MINKNGKNLEQKEYLKHGDWVCDCRFCGDKVIVENGGYWDGLFIRCKKCGSEHHYKKNYRVDGYYGNVILKKKAINIYNSMVKKFQPDKKYKNEIRYFTDNICDLYKQYGKKDEIKKLSYISKE